MNPLVALPFSLLGIVFVILVWTGFRDKRSSESKAGVQLKSARQLLVEIMKPEEKQISEQIAKK